MLEAVRGLRTLWAMPASRITVSTVGVVNRIRSLAADAPGVNLALSLHAPTQELRLRLVPSSRSYTLPKLMAAVDDYCRASAQQVMVEYILIDGVNASDDEARELGALLCGRDVQCNLIPYNSTAAGDVHGYRSPTDEQTQQFAAAVTALARVAVTVRWSTMHGREADAACGQLALRSQAGPPPRHDEGSCDVGEIEDLSLGGETAASAGTRAGVVGTVHGIDADAAAEATALAGAVVEAEAQLGELERALLADGVPAEWVPLYARRVFDSDRVEVPRGGSAGAAAAGEGLAAPESVHAAAYGRRLREALSAALGGALESLHLLEQDTPTPPMQHALKCAGRAVSAKQRKQASVGLLLAGRPPGGRVVLVVHADRASPLCRRRPTRRGRAPLHDITSWPPTATTCATWCCRASIVHVAAAACARRSRRFAWRCPVAARRAGGRVATPSTFTRPRSSPSTCRAPTAPPCSSRPTPPSATRALPPGSAPRPSWRRYE